MNIFLLGAKVFVLVESNSKAVAASLADSAVDLVSQVGSKFYNDCIAMIYFLIPYTLGGIIIIGLLYVEALAKLSNWEIQT